VGVKAVVAVVPSLVVVLPLVVVDPDCPVVRVVGTSVESDAVVAAWPESSTSRDTPHAVATRASMSERSVTRRSTVR
jgi:hypothetical protein